MADAEEDRRVTGDVLSWFHWRSFFQFHRRFDWNILSWFHWRSFFSFYNRISWSVLSWFHWRPTSMMLLAMIEQKILKTIKSRIDSLFVSIHHNEWRIRTVVVNSHLQNTPLVMMHGMGGGLGLWAMNLDYLASSRPVYTFDLLGFGRSSRPTFSSEPLLAELQFVDSIEEWRQQMHLEKFILLGHSLGSFLASSYALKYPERIQHLILVEPWGFPQKPETSNTTRQLSLWAKALITVARPFNPLAIVRFLGPLGPGVVRRFRPDLQKRFSLLFDDDTILSYIYHCNAQMPSGESAFKTMTIPFGWAKHPMVCRVSEIDKKISMTLVYGSRSWIDSSTGYQVKLLRNDFYVDVQVIRGAGHHVYADQVGPFNKLVDEVCKNVDEIPQKSESLHHY